MPRLSSHVSVLTLSLLSLAIPGGHAKAQLAGSSAAVEAKPTTLPRTVNLVLREGSRLWFEGDSNLHAWSCEAPSLTAEVALDRAGAEGLPTRVESASLSVPVLDIDCGDGRMNNNLRKALGADEHPHIRFTVDDATFGDPAADGRFEVLVRGGLSVAGVNVPIEIPVAASDTGSGALKVTGRIDVLMTHFGIEPPSALLGLLKTKNEVVILFDLVLGYAELEALVSGN